MHDGDGLVTAWLLDGRGGGRPLDWPAVRAWTPGQGVLWTHLDAAADAVQDWLAGDGGVGELAAEALLAPETRPRVATLDEGTVIVLRGVNLNPGADPEDMVSIRIWTDGRRFISTRRRRLLAVEDLHAALAAGHGPHGADDLLAFIADRLVYRMEGVVEALKEGVDRLEEEVLAVGRRQLRTELSELRREAVILRRYLVPQRDALRTLTTEPPPWLGREARPLLREVLDGLTRFVEDLDAVRDRAAIVQEELANRLSERMEQRMYALTLVATVFLPLTFLTGLLGVNLAGIPGAGNPWAFILLCLVLVGVGGVQVWLFRRGRWFDR